MSVEECRNQEHLEQLRAEAQIRSWLAQRPRSPLRRWLAERLFRLATQLEPALIKQHPLIFSSTRH